MIDKGVSKCLVIDASVAHAAGGEKAIYPTSVYCRDFLKAVLDICHKFVMTPDIREEWNNHQSQFARKWRSQMVAKGKFEFLDVSVNQELWDKIDAIAATDKQRRDMFKDLRLIEAAIATDKTVISLDDNTARKLFSRAATEVDELKDIVWVNPTKVEEEKPIEWLKNGANPEENRLLVNWRDSC
ncbi:MAG TPA: hypothetical protein DEG17_14545 [Cyanobacteria bacterium UBA11149]|nr:hypothetical protein [Cyanobacteria bacterium UBA11367]HBE57662.1 hypothetical protein [Cyanobacteria bacterium UBA11366]HBK62080.1 hypothetical protein [Cyanobacteria bacterium UBA11166]HBR76371.1 hypothetical protein [Cyanobacteria bacterium UBA11159]HBS71675.1 hypothetical protein [Cyanobacteria bacterium UBA11153]HBW90057.1 hypothetical protein [Cyanobacteria bacterium UBA11149]HCA94869.1 hypothetical protein [Cyanobacteria bacterium UBA9226]